MPSMIKDLHKYFGGSDDQMGKVTKTEINFRGWDKMIKGSD